MGVAVVALAMLLSVGPSVAQGGTEALPSLSPPLLMVLCEHFDLVAPYRVDRGTLVAAAPPTALSSPHDGVWDAPRRLLHVIALHKEQSCIVTFAVSADGAMRRVCDPIPTQDRLPNLVALGGPNGVLLAWSGAHVQAFPVNESGLPTPPTSLCGGVEGLVVLDAHRLVTLRAGRVQMCEVAPHDGSLTFRGGAVDGGPGASALAVDPRGRDVYVVNLEDFTRHVRVLEMGPEGVRPSAGVTLQTREEAQKRVTCTSRAIYVVHASDVISTYVGQGASRVPVGLPVPTAVGLSDLLVTRAVAYAVGAGDPTIHVHPVASGDGRLKPSRRVPLPRSTAGGLSAGTRILILEEGLGTP